MTRSTAEQRDTNHGQNHGPVTRDRLAQVFDAEYYVRCYGDEAMLGLSPLEHFLVHGLDRGWKPNPTFDPFVCKLRFPDLDKNGVLEHLVGPQQGIGFYADLSALLPNIRPMGLYRPVRKSPIDASRNIEAAQRYADPCSIPLQVEDATYHLTVPGAEEWKNRFNDDRPFAFARITHGDWDALYAYQYYQSEVRAAAPELSTEAIDRLSARLCEREFYREMIFEENFLFEFIEDMKNHIQDENFFNAIAFKGYPLADERHFEWSPDDDLDPSDLGKLGLFSEFFGSSETLYDAIIWKRWLISGDISYLSEVARDRPVIFMGANRLSKLGERWQLPWFLHIPIPPTHAYRVRYSLLKSCHAKISEANEIALRHGTKRPIFLLQGSSFAYWFITRLFRTDPDIFYLDLGQALHPWFYDDKTIGLLNWGRLYGPTILKNTGLESYYRRLGVDEPVADVLFKKRKK